MKKKNKVKRQSDSTTDNDVGETGRAGGKKKRVNYAAFVQAWNSSSSVAEVADKVGVKTNSASAIAARLRKAGVTTLKQYPRRGAQVIDVKALNKLGDRS